MSEDKIWACYPITLRAIADELDAWNAAIETDGFDDEMRQWITDDINGEIEIVSPGSRDKNNEGYGFGWIIPCDFEDEYGVCLFETPYSDFTMSPAKLRVLADFLDSLDEVDEKVDRASSALGDYQEFGLPGKIPIIRDGYDEDILGHAVDEVGGSYSFKAQQP